MKKRKYVKLHLVDLVYSSIGFFSKPMATNVWNDIFSKINHPLQEKFYYQVVKTLSDEIKKT